MAFTDVEMAILSQCAYYSYPGEDDSKTLYDFLDHLEKNKKIKEKLSNENFELAFDSLKEKVKDKPYIIVKSVDSENDRTGFAAMAIRDPGDEITIVCRGTEFGLDEDGIKDLLADVQLTNTLESPQQATMRKFVTELEDDGYQKFIFSGHSLGGNLAMYGALCLKDSSKLEQVATYNAPGFNAGFLEVNKQALSNVSSKFTNFQNERDFVSESFEVPGKIVILQGSEDNQSDPLGWNSHSLNKLVITADGDSYNFVPNSTGKKDRTLLGDAFGVGTTITNVFTAPTMVGAYYTAQVGSTVANGLSGTSALLKVPIDSLQECAAKMRALADDNVSIFDRLYNTLQCIEGSGEWTGASEQAAITATKRNKQKYSEAVNELNDLANFVQKFASEISAKEEEIARIIASV